MNIELESISFKLRLNWIFIYQDFNVLKIQASSTEYFLMYVDTNVIDLSMCKAKPLALFYLK